MKNYFTLERFSLLYDHYAFIDVPVYYADQLFIQHQVTVRFGKEFIKAEEKIYRLVFRCDTLQDYFTYAAAKALLPLRHKAARKTLLTASQGHIITVAKHDHGRSQIKAAGIYPFCFLARDGKIPRLDNPIKLIYIKLRELGLTIDDQQFRSIQ